MKGLVQNCIPGDTTTWNNGALGARMTAYLFGCLRVPIFYFLSEIFMNMEIR